MKRAFGIVSLLCFSGAPIAACDGSNSPVVGASDASDTGGETSAPIADAASDVIADTNESGTTCTLPVSYGSKSCNDCMQVTCCSEIAACEGNADCKAMQSCVVACYESPTPKECYDECVNQHPAAQVQWDALYKGCWYNVPGCGIPCT